MKRITNLVLISFLVVFGFMGAAMAQDTLEVLPSNPGISLTEQVKKIPGMKQGIGFSLIENEVNYLSTVELLAYKGFALEGGFNSKDKVVAVISKDLVNLKKMGVTLPLLDLVDVRIGAYCGYGSINSQEIDRSEFDAGVSLTAISVKF